MLLSSEQRTLLNEATEAYSQQGLADEELVTYLQGRGFNRRVAVGNRLGRVCDPMPGHDQYQGRMSIPYLTKAGTVGLKFRDMTHLSKSKYMGLPGQHPRLYNVRALHSDSDHVCIVEGELDALVMHDLVGVPTVGVPGTSVWLSHMPRCFADFARVFVVTDNDTDNEQNPGQKLAKKIAESIRGVTVVLPPAGLDVNDWYLADGPDAIRKKMGL
jgi:5S rRNA maturation endonuclease (ribonuclease M5)